MEPQEKPSFTKKLKNYWPLVALLGVSIAGACALSSRWEDGTLGWMHNFMGLALLSFSLLKLFDIKTFAEGYALYDIVAMRYKPYGLIYPFIELGLGLGYLSFFAPGLIYLLTIGFAALGTVGVFQALKRGLDTRCVCMGTSLNVPLSTVTLSEDLGMGILAILMLFGIFG